MCTVLLTLGGYPIAVNRYIISNINNQLKKQDYNITTSYLNINQLDALNFIMIVSFMPLHVSNTCAHRQEVKIVLYSLWFRLPSIGVMIPEVV